MASQRQYEKDLWAFLAGYLMGASGDELAQELPADSYPDSESEWDRFGNAVQHLVEQIHRKSC